MNIRALYIQICVTSSLCFPVEATEKSAAFLCQKHIMRVEQELAIPSGLLSAIAITESGYKTESGAKIVSWPWVLNVEGKPSFFKTKTDALLALKKHLSEGKLNIDVGCMQINYRHHGHRFQSPLYMLDPRRNVLYAGQFLKNLKARFSSWTKSVGYYHSATMRYQVPYRNKVYKAWRLIRSELKQRGIQPQSAHLIHPNHDFIPVSHTKQPSLKKWFEEPQTNQSADIEQYKSLDEILFDHPHPDDQ